jgi:hypothetical protein
LLFLDTLKWRAHLGQWPDFHLQTVFESGTPFGDFNRFLQVIDLEQKITANRFLRFSERHAYFGDRTPGRSVIP